MVLHITFCGVSILANPLSDRNKAVDELVQRMTMQEKIGQLQQVPGNANGNYKPELVNMVKQGYLGSTLNIRGAKITNQLQRIAVEESRLKIPILFAFDVIAGYQTIFPEPLAQASSWDLDLIEKIEATAAREAYAAGIKWTFAPMLDIARDPRWGRIVEGAGEDPYLGAQIAKARVLGFQGQELGAKNKILACAKHWVGYGAAQAGREYNTTDISEPELRNIYFPPFKAAVDAGVATVMSGFNDLNGVPSSGNPFILRQVLHDEWKFKGFVVSDWESIDELIKHGFAADEKEAAFHGFSAGVDMEMTSQDYRKHLAQLVKESRISQEQLDDSVRRILRMKYNLGLFENPYVSEDNEKPALGPTDHLRLAREAAVKSMVLLKNEKNILPIQRNIKSIAVIGPLADDRDASLGWWRGDHPHQGEKFRDNEARSVVSVLSGLRNHFSSKTKISFSKACDISFCSRQDLKKAVALAKSAQLAIVVVGESAEMSGEAGSRSQIDLPGGQLELVKAIQATGVKLVVVLVNGRPLAIPWIAENVPVILEAWFGGQEAGNAVADILTGDENPSGKLPITVPRSIGQVPIYYNQKNSGRPNDLTKPKERYFSKYLDESNLPQFAFGYGLSFTQFTISDLKISATSIDAQANLKVSVQVENIGKRAGDEVVQLYIHRLVGSITRPQKELKAFRRISLTPGKKQNIEFILGPNELGFYGKNNKFSVEPGKIELIVGNSSLDGLKTSFEIR